MIRIGTAGWSIPRDVASHFAGDGSHLTRYARVLRCAEINSSFYRAHLRETYARWADQTPQDFRFAVKLPQTCAWRERTYSRDYLKALALELSQASATREIWCIFDTTASGAAAANALQVLELLP